MVPLVVLAGCDPGGIIDVLKQVQSKAAPLRALALFALAAGVVLAALPASAGTISGATGLIDVPSADVLGEGELELGVRYTGGELGLSAVYGIWDEVEVGVNNTRAGEHGVGFVFKGVLLRETDSLPAVAIGLENGRSYAVASKRVAPRVRLHAGYGAGQMQGLFAGISYALTTVRAGGAGVPATTLFGEYTPKGLNAGARLVFSPTVSADIALLDLKEAAAGVNFRLSF